MTTTLYVLISFEMHLVKLSFSLPMQLYLVDTFTFAASALSAASVRLFAFIPNLTYVETCSQVFRSLFGCVFPLFGAPMFAALGIGGGNSLLGG
jgi:hypothetical protein